MNDIPRRGGRSDPAAARIRLLVSDIDGTLVTRDKRLTPGALAAAASLREAGIRLALVSSRPARGMEMFVGPLALDTPRAGLNGGEILAADGRLLSQVPLDAEVAREAIEVLDAHGVEPWLFAEGEWLIRAHDDGPDGGAYAEREFRAVRLPPRVVTDFTPHCHRVGKIMGSSSDHPLLERVERLLQTRLRTRVNAHRSQLYFLDVTHPDANKGSAALDLARLLDVSPDEMACIGDMGNDIAMLEQAGLAIAMGNSTDEVRQAAHMITASNEEEGWALAVDRLLLPRRP